MASLCRGCRGPPRSGQGSSALGADRVRWRGDRGQLPSRPGRARGVRARRGLVDPCGAGKARGRLFPDRGGVGRARLARDLGHDRSRGGEGFGGSAVGPLRRHVLDRRGSPGLLLREPRALPPRTILLGWGGTGRRAGGTRCRRGHFPVRGSSARHGGFFRKLGRLGGVVGGGRRGVGGRPLSALDDPLHLLEGQDLCLVGRLVKVHAFAGFRPRGSPPPVGFAARQAERIPSPQPTFTQLFLRPPGPPSGHRQISASSSGPPYSMRRRPGFA